jgi:formyltetrahydrofolate hydrolase
VPSPDHASLIVQGRDRTGIVSAVGSVLAGHDANIVSLDLSRAVKWHGEDRVIRNGRHTIVFA